MRGRGVPAHTPAATLGGFVPDRQSREWLALTHCSPLPVRDVCDVAEHAVHDDAFTHANKPRGLWLALGDAWISRSLEYGAGFRKEHFGRASLTYGRGYHMYRAHVSPHAVVPWAPGTGVATPSYADCQAGRHRSHLLMLVTVDAAREFHRRYRVQHLRHAPHDECVDWQRVAHHFAGVYVLANDFTPRDMRWFRDWELPSACVWRPSALRLALQELPASHARATVRRCKLKTAAAAW